jgi:hypothetical protein
MSVEQSLIGFSVLKCLPHVFLVTEHSPSGKLPLVHLGLAARGGAFSFEALSDDGHSVIVEIFTANRIS